METCSLGPCGRRDRQRHYHQDSGELKLFQYQRVDGKWAYGVNLFPDGKYAIVSCLDDDGAVLSFHVETDGKVTPHRFPRKRPQGCLRHVLSGGIN